MINIGTPCILINSSTYILIRFSILFVSLIRFSILAFVPTFTQIFLYHYPITKCLWYSTFSVSLIFAYSCVISTSKMVTISNFFRYKYIWSEHGWIGHFNLWALSKTMLPCLFHLGVQIWFVKYHIPTSTRLTCLFILHRASLAKLFPLRVSSETFGIWELKLNGWKS